LQAATLVRRAKAIDHLRKALVDIEDTQVIKGETVNNVREAVRLSELVFDGSRERPAEEGLATSAGPPLTWRRLKAPSNG
jgi:hypothetical protein